MSMWPTNPSWTDPTTLNNGKKYGILDGVTASDMNTIIQNLLYLFKEGGSGGGADSALPIEVSTEAEMTALLTSGEVGGVYKYTGTTGTYENGALYVLVEEAKLIYFSVDLNDFTAEEGMTWREWMESSYNTVEARWLDSASDGTGMQIKVDGVYKFVYYNGDYVQDYETIVVNGAYTTTAPVVEDELQGTWLLKVNLTIPSGRIYKVQFTSDGNSYSMLGLMYQSDVMYDSEVAFSYDRATPWLNENYRYINITSKRLEVTDVNGNFYDNEGVDYGMKLLDWLWANATKQ